MIHELELDLDPCRFCHQSNAEPSLYEDDKVLAIECRACGARGPLRPVLRPESVEAVARLAAADWNMGGTPNTSERATTEAAPGARRKRPLAKKNGPSLGPHKGRHRKDKPLESLVGSSEAGAPVKRGRPKKELPKGASVEQSSNKAAGELHPKDRNPDNGGEAVPKPKRQPVTKRDSSPEITAKQLDVGERLASGLGLLGMTAQAAADKGIDLGVHVATIYTVLKGKRVSNATLDKISAALDKLEGKGLAKVSADTPIERIPNKFAPITGTNRTAPPTAPPRCGSVP